jgi:hypothetical protein
MYPEHYRRIAARCRQENTTLRAGEQRYFVFDHAEAMAELAAKWNLPRKIYEVLKHVLKPYHFVRQLSEPLQSQVQLLKLSTFLGRLAVERWQSWDTVDLPPPSVFRRLRSPESALAKIRSAVEEAERMPKSDRLESGSGTDDTTLVCGALDYVSLCPLAPDPLEAILATAGVIASDGAYKRGSGSKQILVNTVGATAPELAQLEAVCRSKAETILLCERQQESRLRSLGQVLCTPIGYGTLCSACRIAAEAGSESDPDERVEAEP